MKYDIEESGISVTMTAANFDVAVTESAPLEVAVGECARIEVGEAINYIKTGQAEIAEAVADGIGDFNTNAEAKTTAFNNNATSKTNAFNDNATTKTAAFNANVVDKTNAFNTNAATKQAAVDAAVAVAQYYAENIKFGMVRREIAVADWILVSGKYELQYQNQAVSAVYKQNGTKYDLMTNIDIATDSSGVTIISPEAFTGYVLLVNGEDAGGDKTFVYEQAIAADVWVINHNLAKYPSVTVADSAGNIFYPAVKYNNENRCTVMMNGATTGKAFLN